MKQEEHIPVMLDEVIDMLNITEGTYVDCTFGMGGYSKEILLKKNTEVIAFDQDPDLVEYAKSVKDQYGTRFSFFRENFVNLNRFIEKKVNGIVFDLGVSTFQLMRGERGFSFSKDGPLDMRMSKSGLTAKDLINKANEKQIAEIINKYGEEKKALVIAKKIKKYGEVTTTKELAEIIYSSVGRKKIGKIDRATKVFQAIRIWVNNELDCLRRGLHEATKLLNINGRIVVITFHSLEDSIIKNFFKSHTIKKISRSKYKDPEPQEESLYKILTPKPITPTSREVKRNIKSRSAKLRAAEKLKEIL